MWKKRLAALHRRIAGREHADEKRMLKLAPKRVDPQRARAEAYDLSASAERHRAIADQLEDSDGRSD